MRKPTARSWFGLARRALAWLAGALLLLVAAWVVSNLRDADPLPRPAALALHTPQLADDNNAFFALVGLHAGADREPAAAGQALWRIRMSQAAAPRDMQAAQRAQHAESEALGQRLPSLSGAPSVCHSQSDDCMAPWIAQADALAAHRKAHATLGQRCESLLDQNFEFEERLPPMRSAAEPFAAHAHSASACSRWLLSGAALAWAQKRPADAVMLVVKADRLNRGLLAGSHSLIGQVIALRLARNTLNAITGLALRDPAMATALAPLLAPWPDEVQAARRWMVAEAALAHGMLGDALQTCLSIADDLAPDATSWLQRIEDQFDRFMCRHRIGLHPERTRAALDQRWLRIHAALDRGLPAAIVQLAADSQAADAAGLWGVLSWRNPVGNLLVAVADPGYRSYLARQADVELHREAAALALQAAAVAPAGRAAWTERQAQSQLVRGRLSWDAKGDTLTARTLQQEYAGGAGFNAERDAIRITFPKP